MRPVRVSVFAKTKTNIGDLPLSRWKTIGILKITRFQSLNFTSKPKGYLLQIRGKSALIVINRRKKKSDESKRRSKLFKLEKGKVC